MSSAQLATLARALESNQSVTTLSILGDRFDEEGECLQSFSNLFRNHRSLKRVRMEHSALESQRACVIAEAIECSRSIEHLDITLNMLRENGSASVVQMIRNSQSLTSLCLRHCFLNEKDAKLLGDAMVNNTKLRSLDVSWNDFGSFGMMFFTEGLKKNSSLTSLNVSQNKFGSEGAKFLIDMLSCNQSLKEVHVDDNDLCDDDAVRMCNVLKTNQVLGTLSFSRNDSMSLKGFKAFSDLLSISSPLTRLKLDVCKAGVESTITLAEGLKNNGTLVSLDLGSNRVCSGGACAIFKALQSNSTLTHLMLNNNGIEGSADCMKALAGMLSRNSSLKKLNLESNLLGLGGNTSLLIEGLRGNRCITHLDVGGNELQSEQLAAMIECIMQNNTMLTLNISYNNLHGEGAMALAQLLKKNHSLRHLDVSRCHMVAIDIEMIAHSLISNNALERLRCFSNAALDVGVSAMVEALKVNTSLRSIFFDCSVWATDIEAAVGALDNYNGSVVQGSEAFKSLRVRNKRMHARAQQSVVTFMAIRTSRRQLQHCPKEIIVLIAQALYATKVDVASWFRTLN